MQDRQGASKLQVWRRSRGAESELSQESYRQNSHGSLFTQKNSHSGMAPGTAVQKGSVNRSGGDLKQVRL